MHNYNRNSLIIAATFLPVAEAVMYGSANSYCNSQGCNHPGHYCKYQNSCKLWVSFICSFWIISWTATLVILMISISVSVRYNMSSGMIICISASWFRISRWCVWVGNYSQGAFKLHLHILDRAYIHTDNTTCSLLMILVHPQPTHVFNQ